MSNQLVSVSEIKKLVVSGPEVKRVIEDNYIQSIVHKYPKLNNGSLLNHLNLVSLTGANPFNGQVHFVAFYDKNLGQYVGTTVFSFRFFEDRANATGEFLSCPCEVKKATYFNPVTGKEVETLVATATAYRKNREPVVFEAWWPEYYDQKKSIWNMKPHTMLRKCAIAGALRSAFPETLGTMYISDEVKEDDVIEEGKIQARVDDIEVQVEQAEKTEEIVREAKEFKNKDAMIDVIKKIASKLTDGMSRDQKFAWMKNVLKVDSFPRLKGLKVAELESLIDELRNAKKEPIVVEPQVVEDTKKEESKSESMTTEDIPW